MSSRLVGSSLRSAARIKDRAHFLSRQPSCVALTSISTIGIVLLAPRQQTDLLSFIFTVAVWSIGTVAGLWSFLGAGVSVEGEIQYAKNGHRTAESLLRSADAPSPGSENLELRSLRGQFLRLVTPQERWPTHETIDLAVEVFEEAQHRRFPGAASLSDRVEATRPDQLRALRLVQVQALRAGILGTFIGLLFGLTNITSSNSVGEMLSGMRVGFGTSIAGLIIAVWAGFLAHDLSRRQRLLREAIYAMLTSLSALVSRATQRDEFFREVPQVTRAMTELRHDLRSRTQELMQTLGHAASSMAKAPEVLESLRLLLDAHVAGIKELREGLIMAWRRQFDEISDHTKQAREYMDSTTSAIKTGVVATKEVGESIVTEIQAIFGADLSRRFHDDSVTKLNDLSALYMRGLEQFHTTMKEGAESQALAMKQHSRTIDTAMATAATKLDQMSADTKVLGATVKEELQRVFGTEAVRSLDSKTDARLQRLVDELRKMITGIDARLGDLNRGYADLHRHIDAGLRSSRWTTWLALWVSIISLVVVIFVIMRIK